MCLAYFAGWLGQPARYRVQLIVHCARLSAPSASVGITMFRYLQRRRLARQRKHLVHGDPGSDRCIAQAGLPIVSSMRVAPHSATSLRIPTMLFFRALISAASRPSHCSDRFPRNAAELTNLDCRNAFA